MEDPRIGSILLEYNKNEIYDVVFVGFPYDEGCIRNGGRYGSKSGPYEIRKLLLKMGTIDNPELNIDISKLKIADFGNICENNELEKAHTDLENTVKYILEKNKAIPVIIGGSNDQSYVNASAFLNTKKNLSKVINIDAHLDVRPLKDNKVHSGSPFRLLLEDERFTGELVEFSCQGSQCSRKHADYVLSNGHKILWLSDIKDNIIENFTKLVEKKEENIFLSFDIDSIRASDCPGVSCPSTRGISAEDALDICYQAGLSNNIRIFDISEFNPRIENSITPRLVVNMIIYFLMGLSNK